MQVLSTILVALVALASGAGTIYVMHQAGPHATLGTWSEMWIPLFVPLAVGLVAAGSLGLGAWALWRREHKMASQLMGILAVLSPIMIVQVVDAANVLYDTSEGIQRETTLIEMRKNKNQEFFLLRSWRDPESTLLIDTGDIVWERVEPGAPAMLVVHAGAFGRPYAVSLSPR